MTMAPCYAPTMPTTAPRRTRSGPALSEETLAGRGWTREGLRLPPAESEALEAVTLPGETPGLAIRRLILEAKTRLSRKSTRPRK